MSEVEKLKAKRKAERINDPHAWAFEIEKRADERALFGVFASVLSLILAVNVWFLWQERDKLERRIEAMERAWKPSPEIEQIMKKYLPDE